jgi:hypothetical protein
MKTRYLLFLAFLFICHPRTTLSSPTLALSGAGCSNVNPGAGSTVSCLVAPLNTLGRAQIVAIKWCDDSTCTTDTSGDTFTITDTALNSYGSCQRLDSASGTDRRGMAVCHAQNIAAHSSNSVLLSITSGNTVQLAGLIVSEVMGGTASVTVDQHGHRPCCDSSAPQRNDCGRNRTRKRTHIFLGKYKFRDIVCRSACQRWHGHKLSESAVGYSSRYGRRHCGDGPVEQCCSSGGGQNRDDELQRFRLHVESHSATAWHHRYLQKSGK